MPRPGQVDCRHSHLGLAAGLRKVKAPTGWWGLGIFILYRKTVRWWPATLGVAVEESD